MASTFYESNLRWTFPDGWKVIKYDDSTWYRKHFQACADSKAVDFIVVGSAEAWLVEVKDFTRTPPTPHKAQLWEAVTQKVRDSLAGALAGAWRAEPHEREVFRALMAATTIRVVLHLERPKHVSGPFSKLPDAADLRDKLRKTLRAVDTKVLVRDSSTTHPSVPWTVEWKP